jgi:hypothetical protein
MMLRFAVVFSSLISQRYDCIRGSCHLETEPIYNLAFPEICTVVFEKSQGTLVF